MLQGLHDHKPLGLHVHTILIDSTEAKTQRKKQNINNPYVAYVLVHQQCLFLKANQRFLAYYP